jgi:hypothetical protein
MSTALKKIDGPIADQWLIVAEFARQAYVSSVEEFLSQVQPNPLSNWHM